MTISDVHLLTGHEPGARGARAAKFQQPLKNTACTLFFCGNRIYQVADAIQEVYFLFVEIQISGKYRLLRNK
jgi:hypothetical protein